MTWSGLWRLGGRLERLRDAHDTVLGTSEDASVWCFRVRDEFNLGVSTDWMSPLHSVHWHGISDGVISQVHVLVDHFLESSASEESLTSLIHKDILPDNLFLALG